MELTSLIQGIYYFLAHPFLYPLFRARLLPSVLLSIFVLTNLFLWTYIPQVLFLRIFHGHLAWLNATFLVLGEGAAIISLLFEAFFVDETLVDVFDAVLVNEGLSDLVATSRPLDSTASDPVKQLGKPTNAAVYSPFSLRQIMEFVLFLPFNLVPVVGVPIFLLLTGYRHGPLQHWRYFKLLGFDKQTRNQYIKKRQLRYTWFGAVALVLQLVPVLSMFFLLTSAAGSALWVVEMEKLRRRVEGRRQGLEGDEPYTDDPA